METALMFPGQGSQKVGMGKGLSGAFEEAREVFEEVDEALGENLSRVMWGEDQEELTKTRNAQPALFAVGAAAYRALEGGVGMKESGVGVKARYAAGHSLGEYGALFSAGVLGISSGARLLRLRGDLMAKAASEGGGGGMTAVMGLEVGAVESAAIEAAGLSGEVCEVAGDNAPGQVVLSGGLGGLEEAERLLKEAGARRAVRLAVSAPFHCALMEKAAQEFEEALAGEDFGEAKRWVVPNVTAKGTRYDGEGEDEEAAWLLRRQITDRVRWRESMEWLKGEGVGMYVELGPGKVLCGLAKRCAPEGEALGCGEPEELEEAMRRMTS